MSVNYVKVKLTDGSVHTFHDVEVPGFKSWGLVNTPEGLVFFYPTDEKPDVFFPAHAVLWTESGVVHLPPTDDKDAEHDA